MGNEVLPAGPAGYMFEAPFTADGLPVVPGRAYVLLDSAEAGPMAGRRVVAVGVDPVGGRALYVDAEEGDLIDAAPARLLLSAQGPVAARKKGET